MYACETWSATQEKFLTFERKIHKPVRLKNGDYERRKNENLEILINKPNIRLFLKTKRSE
jgi:hypothetical protein